MSAISKNRSQELSQRLNHKQKSTPTCRDTSHHVDLCDRFIHQAGHPSYAGERKGIYGGGTPGYANFHR